MCCYYVGWNGWTMTIQYHEGYDHQRATTENEERMIILSTSLVSRRLRQIEIHDRTQGQNNHSFDEHRSWCVRTIYLTCNGDTKPMKQYFIGDASNESWCHGNYCIYYFSPGIFEVFLGAFDLECHVLEQNYFQRLVPIQNELWWPSKKCLGMPKLR